MSLGFRDLNKVAIDRDERLRLEFLQRNIILNFFMDKSTYGLQDILKRFSEMCMCEEEPCDICRFAENDDIISLITMWCECGHSFGSHICGNHGNGRCLVCHCEHFNELKMNNPYWRREYDFRPQALNCRGCNLLNKDTVARDTGDNYICSECKDSKKCQVWEKKEDFTEIELMTKDLLKTYCSVCIRELQYDHVIEDGKPEPCWKCKGAKQAPPVRKRYDCADCGDPFFEDEMEYHEIRGVHSLVCESCLEDAD